MPYVGRGKESTKEGLSLRETWKYLGLQTPYLEKITMLRVLLFPNSCLMLYKTQKQKEAILWVSDRYTQSPLSL